MPRPPSGGPSLALDERLATAINARRDLLCRLHAEDTNCYRLLHGVAEGLPGTTVDRYGPLLLVQTWRQPHPPEALRAAAGLTRELLGLDLAIVERHRGPSPTATAGPRRRPARDGKPPGPSAAEGSELGLRYDVRPQPDRTDPLLFLDLRAGRRAILHRAAGISVLNLFAYTCGMGLCAARAGAKEVWNVDFSASALAVGRANAARNGIDERRFQLVCEDVIPVMRQLAGLPLKGRGARRRNVREFGPRQFDLVVMDPPDWSTGPFGAVDIVRDYESLFKPAVLATAPGGWVFATNHAPRVPRAHWLDRLVRCAAKAGRGVTAIEIVHPEGDFPALGVEPALKMAWLQVGTGDRERPAVPP